MSVQTGLCLGCHRTLDEIANWSEMTDRDRRLIMQELKQRASQRTAQPAVQPPVRPASDL